MTDNETVVFDEKSGISIEEQKEILSEINGITETNRRLLSQNAPAVKQGKKTVIAAKKRGVFFPLAVNIAAIAILCAGAIILFSVNRRTDSQIRTGSAVYTLTERALIDEIRKDTAEKIAAKEMEIAFIASHLAEVDARLFQLASSNQELTADQLASREMLLSQQNSYREELAVLQGERSQILSDSWFREANLRAQLEERAREFASTQQAISAELQSALAELDRLTSERERFAAMEAMIIASQGHSGAQSTVVVSSTDDALLARNTQLEQNIADLQRTVEALSSGSTGLESRLLELDETVSALRASVSSLEATVAQRDRTITSLEANILERERSIASLERENAALNRTIAENENVTRDLQARNNAQAQEIINLTNQINTIREVLQSLSN